MVPSGSAISAAAITALPDSASNNGEVTLRSRVTFQSVPLDPYRAFVTDASRQLVYAVEISRRRLSTADT